MSLNIAHPEEWPELMTADEVAELLRFSRTRIQKWCASGDLEASRIGTQWRIPRIAVWRMMPRSTIVGWGEGPWQVVLQERGPDATPCTGGKSDPDAAGPEP